MPFIVDDIIRLLCYVSDQQKMRAAVKHSARGALIAGTGAFLGGLMGGPPGFVVGGAVGGLVAWMTSRRFKPITQIIMELPPEQQKVLCDRVYAIIRNLERTDATELIKLVSGQADLKKKVVTELISFVSKELQAEIQYGD